uniref:DNA-directed RNA polymerase n=1 Tax=viral metagenome TaxID=1070528 RepID=A0A6C0M4A0_9ZZZZ
MATIPPRVSKIVGIQFSILSPEEIRKGAVTEITSRDTYVGNKPVLGGLFCPYMGVSEPGMLCPTDGLDYMNTPGYFGRIELAMPVFYYQHLNTIHKILRCVCLKCSRLLLNKEEHKQALKMAPDERWSYVFGVASKVKRCGDDNEEGCGCLMPKKIRKENLATLIAEWDSDGVKGMSEEDAKKMNMQLTPDIVLKIFRRISDDDVSFMGFSPTFSRPDWMICQVLAVPPPAVRPSIKMDGQQRSEDDLTHIIVNIVKANKTLQEKMRDGAQAHVWHMVLQYYCATLVDNNIPGAAPVAQRSGRKLKSIKERLNGKGGRVRGNLMGKRVDFSARSVITPDPNLSIKELGVPLKIAKNITKPVVVNDMNRRFLMRLVRNGPDEYPGAKILERKGGENISLRYADRENIVLYNGDIVHRHMMDGDGVLFNRQPTLHRMSMMCHIARIMRQGDTFRMNVGDTKPYNADFDGDEMNMHMPQDEEAEAELKNLAAVPYQIISPAKNQSIIGIFQDSLLGSYRFTRPNVSFAPREAMNLLMAHNGINEGLFASHAERITSFQILSQIMPSFTMKYKTKGFGEKDDFATSPGVLEIVDGKYLRGQLDKDVLGGGSNGLITRTCNDFGNMAAAEFIDNLQNIVTEYMKSSAYSVGISDLIANRVTNEQITKSISEKKNEVKRLIDQTYLGIFENATGNTNEDEFEFQVTNILNKATNDSGKIGLKSLDKDNRFVTMVKAGSKGSDLNISQMIACLGQQLIDGKRIPYGFENRTLPHFTKYDDSPGARGFVENSFISGLTPEELFFHAMGGRVGLIDTAVKTSSTGYIQRRLIKGMEDLKIEYDMTVRNNKGRVIQFSYGEDGIDPVKVESQIMPLANMGLDEIYAHYHMPSSDPKDVVFTSAFTKGVISRMKKQKAENDVKCKQWIDFMIEQREKVIQRVFRNKDTDRVYLPVAFAHTINNVKGLQQINNNSIVDITPLEAFAMIEAAYKRLESMHYCAPTQLFKAMFYYYLSPKDLLMVKRFNKKALTVLLEMIVLKYKNSLIAPGEMVGMISAQSIGEPTTQLTLNTFHTAGSGVAMKANVTRGVPRIEELLSITENPKNSSLTICLKKDEETDCERAKELIAQIELTQLSELVESVSICFDPDDLNTLIQEDRSTMLQYYEYQRMLQECAGIDVPEEAEADPNDSSSGRSKWIIRMVMSREAMLDKRITMDDVHFAIKNSHGDDVSCIYADYNADKLVFRLRMNNINGKKPLKPKENPLDQSDKIYLLKAFQDQLLNNIVLRGLKNISKVTLRKLMDTLHKEDGAYVKKETWVLDTKGTNLMDVLALDYIDVNRTISDDIQEIRSVLGIEAAREALLSEMTGVFENDGTYINYHHLSLLCDRMTASSGMVSIFRHGINNDNIGPIAKASFEETPEMFLKAARHAELDQMRGISANVMCGQEGYYGTSSFQVMLDLPQMIAKMEDVAFQAQNEQAEIAEAMGSAAADTSACAFEKLTIESNVGSIQKVDLGQGADNYNVGF